MNSIPQHALKPYVLSGGTAGSVIANRLTEDSNTTVLVIEAGISYVAHTYVNIDIHQRMTGTKDQMPV